jgi:hypothetical protein
MAQEGFRPLDPRDIAGRHPQQPQERLVHELAGKLAAAGPPRKPADKRGRMLAIELLNADPLVRLLIIAGACIGRWQRHSRARTRRAHRSLRAGARPASSAPDRAVAPHSHSPERIHDSSRTAPVSRVLRTCLETCAAAFSRKRPGHARWPPGRRNHAPGCLSKSRFSRPGAVHRRACKLTHTSGVRKCRPGPLRTGQASCTTRAGACASAPNGRIFDDDIDLPSGRA